MPGQGVDVGDAVLTFLADTTQLDLAFNQVEAQSATKLTPTNQKLQEVAGNWQFAGASASTAGAEAEIAGDEMVDAAERSARATREAKGEAQLLGEAFGVHLPRHVRSFIAELPGVGTALSAAFSATAILFIIEAIAQLTEKITNFIGDHFIFTEEMKKGNAELAASNVELLKQIALFDKAKQAVDDFGKTQVELADEKVLKLNQAIKEQQEQMRAAQDNLYGYRNGLLSLSAAQVRAAENMVGVASTTIKSLQEQLDEATLHQQKAEEDALRKHAASQISLRKSTTEALINLQEAQAKALVAGTQDEAHKVAAIEQDADERHLNNKIAALQKEKTIEQQYGGKDNADKVRAIEAQINQVREEYVQKYFTQLASEKDALAKTLSDMKASIVAAGAPDIILPANVQRILDMRAAAQALGITLRSDLAGSLDMAKKAKDQFLDNGGKDAVALKAFDDKIKEAQKNLDSYGKSFDTLKLKGETTFKGLVQDLQKGVTVTHELSAAGIQAFDSLSKSLEAAVASAILGQKSFGAAMEQATASALAQLAAQALVKALFYTAEGFAALAGFAYGPAAQYFEAAGIMAAVGAAAGAAGYGMSRAGGGGGGGGGSHGASWAGNNTNNNAGNQAGHSSSIVSVQHFAEGGLVTRPTMAMMGEQFRKEAVIPLEDPRATRQIKDAIGGGGGHTFIIQGLVSPDNLRKVIKQIDTTIGKGRATLTSSNSMRITRRSA